MNVHKPQAMEENSGIFSLQIDATIKNYLSETAKWGRFLSILGFICCGLLILLGLFFGTFFSRFSSGSAYGVNSPYATGYVAGMIWVFYLLAAILYFFPCLFLFRFSGKMKKALAANDQVDLTGAFQNLKSLFRFVGILTIIVLGLYVLGIVAAILVGTAGRY